MCQNTLVRVYRAWINITFYVQKQTASMAMCYDLPLVQDKPLGAPAFVKLFFGLSCWILLSINADF